jgi:hypothetical protein
LAIVNGVILIHLQIETLVVLGKEESILELEWFDFDPHRHHVKVQYPHFLHGE